MRSFKVFFDINDSGFSIAEPYTDKIGELKINYKDNSNWALISLIDSKDILEGVFIHRGLKAIIDVYAESMSEAIDMARIRIEGFLTMLTLVTNATVGEAQLMLGYETTYEAISTEYIQIEYLYSDLFKKKRAFDKIRLDKLGDKLLKNNNKRISRAVRWYRKGLIETDPLDRFMSYWVGLENLNKVLSTLLGENAETRNCTACGEPYEVPIAKGIRSLFEKFSTNGLNDFKLCRDLRVDLQHGSGDLETAINKVNECSELCRIALLKAIFLSLDLNLNEIDSYPKPIYNIHQPYVEFRGEYKISPKDLPTIPLILFDSQNIKVSHVDGKREITLVDSLNTNVTVDMTIEMTFVSEQGVEINLVDVKTVPNSRLVT